MTRRDFLKDAVAFGFVALAGLLPCAAGATCTFTLPQLKG